MNKVYDENNEEDVHYSDDEKIKTRSYNYEEIVDRPLHIIEYNSDTKKDTTINITNISNHKYPYIGNKTLIQIKTIISHYIESKGNPVNLNDVQILFVTDDTVKEQIQINVIQKIVNRFNINNRTTIITFYEKVIYNKSMFDIIIIDHTRFWGNINELLKYLNLFGILLFCEDPKNVKFITPDVLSTKYDIDMMGLTKNSFVQTVSPYEVNNTIFYYSFKFDEYTYTDIRYNPEGLSGIQLLNTTSTIDTTNITNSLIKHYKYLIVKNNISFI